MKGSGNSDTPLFIACLALTVMVMFCLIVLTELLGFDLVDASIVIATFVLAIIAAIMLTGRR